MTMITYSLVSQIAVLVLLTERVWFMLHCHLCRTCFCCNFSFFGRPYVVYCCKCFTVLYYICKMWRSSARYEFDSVSKCRSDIVTSFIHFFCAVQFQLFKLIKLLVRLLSW